MAVVMIGTALNSFAPCTPLVWKLWSNTVAVGKYLVNCLCADCGIQIHVRHWTRPFLPGRVWPRETIPQTSHLWYRANYLSVGDYRLATTLVSAVVPLNELLILSCWMVVNCTYFLLKHGAKQCCLYIPTFCWQTKRHAASPPPP